MPAIVEFVAAYRVDVVGYTDSTFTLEQQETRRKTFFSSLIKSPTYQRIKESTYVQNVGDGVFIVGNSRYAKEFLEIAKELEKNLSDSSSSSADTKLTIKVRTGIHVGQAFVESMDGKVTEVSGNALSYSERLMTLGQAGDILVSASAVNTVLALDGSYQGYLNYAGKYAIKHGETFQVWWFYDSIAGNSKPPAKKKEPLIEKMSSKNKKLGVSLIVLSILGVVLSTQLLIDDFYRSSDSDSKITVVQTSIEREIRKLWFIQISAKEPIEAELAQAYGSGIYNSNTTLREILSNESTYKPIATIIDLLPSTNPDIKYAWVAAPASQKCPILIYKPYDALYDETQDFTKRDWCKNIQNRSDYLTSTIYATGPTQFVNVLVTRLNDEGGPSAITIGYFGMAVDWLNLMPKILAEAYGEGANVRLILEDHGGYISADCTVQGCLDLEALAISRVGPLEPDPEDYQKLTEGLIFSASDYSQLALESRTLNSVDVPGSSPQILTGWKIHLYHPQETSILNPMPIVLFGISVAILGLLVYYYIIPRYWLDDTEQLGPKVKFVYQE